jgi:hypothetical protein
LVGDRVLQFSLSQKAQISFDVCAIFQNDVQQSLTGDLLPDVSDIKE